MIKVADVAFVRFSAPDLDLAERFLNDFGLVTSSRSDLRLHVRGTDGEPYVHVTEQGEPGFLGIAFEASSAEDLAAAAALPGASDLEALPEPGGGQRVRFTDPDGFQVEVVHGRALLESIEVFDRQSFNRGSERRRLGELRRTREGPAQVKRIGHAVLHVSDFERSLDWYQSRFGLLVSDDIVIGDADRVITSFMRCDRGETFVDHHTFLCIGVGEAGFDHAAFEVEDFDAVMLGHEHLEAAGYEHHAGIGRHLLGSQVFDYWRDPWGNVMEHFTDGDLLNASSPAGKYGPAIALGTQWGRFG